MMLIVFVVVNGNQTLLSGRSVNNALRNWGLSVDSVKIKKTDQGD